MLPCPPGLKRSHDLVRAYWSNQLKSADFEAIWETNLNAGVIPNTAATSPSGIQILPTAISSTGYSGIGEDAK